MDLDAPEPGLARHSPSREERGAPTWYFIVVPSVRECRRAEADDACAVTTDSYPIRNAAAMTCLATSNDNAIAGGFIP
jgi:hypothetical protein